MKSGYDQFFKEAKKAAHQPSRSRVSRPTAAPMAKASPMSSDEMVQHLRTQLKPRKKMKPRKTFPIKFVTISFIGLGLAGLGYQKIDVIESQLQKVEVTLFGQAFAEETTPAATQAGADKKSPDAASDKSGASDSTKSNEKSVVRKEYSEEELNHLSKLNERKRELDAREEELNKLEQEIALQKDVVEKKMAELESTRKSISSVLEEKVQADDKKIENLVQVYSTMRPPQAAKALEEMDENLAIEIFGRMKKKNAAEILNLVKAEKVKIFSEKYAGYKQK